MLVAGTAFSTLALVAVLVAEPGREDVVVLGMKPGRLEDPDRVPFAARYPVTDEIPAALLGESMAVRVRGDQLQIDANRNGSFSRRFDPKEPGLLVLGRKPNERTLLVYFDAERWFVAPADVLRGSRKELSVELLDADLDGEFAGECDFVRTDEGAFGPIDEERLLSWGEGLVRYELAEGRRPKLSLEDLSGPAWASKEQRGALRAANAFRARCGLPPLRLDEERSRACRLHAEYLHLNAFDYHTPWDGVGSHDQRPDAPGYSPQGLEAARRGMTGTGTDPREATERLFATMLHRTAFLGPSSSGFGVASIAESKVDWIDGYTALWVDGGALSPPVLVVAPGPGVRGVPKACSSERPAPESLPSFYEEERGYPVSVTFAGMKLADVSLRIEFADTARPVPGHLFTPERPVHSTRLENGSTAFFVAEAPLAPATRYRAVFDARDGEQRMTRDWVFETER